MDLKNLLGFGPVATLSFSFDDHTSAGGKRATIRHPADKTKELPLLHPNDPLTGCLHISVPEGKAVDHNGVILEMLGVIEMPHERVTCYEFASLKRDLLPPSDGEHEGSTALRGEDTAIHFDFSSVSRPHDSYYGRSVRLRYLLRATLLTRSYTSSNLVLEQDVWVQTLGVAPAIANAIKMEVGIEECLHLEFEYNRARYHLQDVVVGKIYFLLVRIKIKHMELAILRRELAGTGTERHSDNETITKFELMDGAPVKGECIPVRLHLAPYALTPTYRNIHNKFSVKYLLNLVLVDEEERRYFKQQEITLWRKTVG